MDDVLVNLNQKVIRKNYAMLEKSLDATDISGSLIADDLITTNMLDEISSASHTSFQKNRTLLKHLLTSRNPYLISKLCDILGKEDANKDIVRTLQGQSRLE